MYYYCSIPEILLSSPGREKYIRQKKWVHISGIYCMDSILLFLFLFSWNKDFCFFFSCNKDFFFLTPTIRRYYLIECIGHYFHFSETIKGVARDYYARALKNSWRVKQMHGLVVINVNKKYAEKEIESTNFILSELYYFVKAVTYFSFKNFGVVRRLYSILSSPPWSYAICYITYQLSCSFPTNSLQANSTEDQIILFPF